MYSRHDLQIVKPIKVKHRHSTKQYEEQDKHEIIINEKAFNAETLPLLLIKLLKGIFTKIMHNHPRRMKGQIF